MNILGLPYTNLQSQAYAGVAEHAINTSSLLNNAIASTAAATYWTTAFPDENHPARGRRGVHFHA